MKISIPYRDSIFPAHRAAEMEAIGGSRVANGLWRGSGTSLGHPSVHTRCGDACWLHILSVRFDGSNGVGMRGGFAAQGHVCVHVQCCNYMVFLLRPAGCWLRGSTSAVKVRSWAGARFPVPQCKAPRLLAVKCPAQKTFHMVAPSWPSWQAAQKSSRIHLRGECGPGEVTFSS